MVVVEEGGSGPGGGTLRYSKVGMWPWAWGARG